MRSVYSLATRLYEERMQALQHQRLGERRPYEEHMQALQCNTLGARGGRARSVCRRWFQF